MRPTVRLSPVLCAAFALAPLSALGCGGRDEAPPRREAQERTESAAPAEPATPAVPRDPRSGETIDGYRVVRAKTKSGELTTIKIKAPEGWDALPVPTSPDPHGGSFTLKEALVGLGPKSDGDLVAKITTQMGSFYCDLYEGRTPKTVANFVGLARGLRKFWDAAAGDWVARPYYTGTTFHRVMPGYFIQGGDHNGTGLGGIGYRIDDEIRDDLEHNRAGQLCLASRGPNGGESQFFITDSDTPGLARRYTVFGQCAPVGLVHRIARVPQSGKPHNRPLTPVTIEEVTIKRVPGGAKSWMPPGAERETQLPGVVPPGRAVKVEPE